MTEQQKQSLANSHGNISDEFKVEQSARLKNYYKNNPDFKSDSKHGVKIINPDTNDTLEFSSRLDFCRFAELPEFIARAGIVNSWIKLGFIKRKNSKYNGWKIFNK